MCQLNPQRFRRRGNDMYKVSYLFLIVFLWGCTLASEEFDILIIGQWESQSIETELGVVQHKITFTANHQFRLESHFAPEDGAMITEGGYEIIGKQLFAKKLNKGKPIPLAFAADGRKLLLYFPAEKPFELERQ